MLTKDTNLLYQQNLNDLPIAVVVVDAPTHKLDDIRPLLPALLEALKDLKPNAVTVISVDS